MKTLLAISVWLILFILCWPIALFALLVWPVIWLLSLPFRLLGVAFTGVFALLTALITLPARMLGWKPATA